MGDILAASPALRAFRLQLGLVDAPPVEQLWLFDEMPAQQPNPRRTPARRRPPQQ